MNYRPYPDTDRALNQLARHHPRAVVIVHADTGALDEALRKLADRVPDLLNHFAQTDAGRALTKAAADADAMAKQLTERFGQPRQTVHREPAR